MTVAPVSVEREGALLTVFTDNVNDGRLQLAAQFASVTVSIGLTRDDVRTLSLALEDWLYESRSA